jgi:hypothetical protein
VFSRANNPMMEINVKLTFLAALFVVPTALAAQNTQNDTAVSVTFSGFADVYYAYYFNLRGPVDAPLLTQPVRDNEFNANLAFLDAKVASDRVRGRFAIQLGTSVSANYAGEPTHGAHAGPLLARHIQEAVAGVRVADNFWVDGGIFFSHIGAESWISRDNWTYTRSMIAEFSPYYESGVKVTWSPSGKFTGTAVLVNGWQNISESNSDKGVGVRLDYSPSSSVTLSYSNFLGNEAPDSVDTELRFFNDFIIKITPPGRFGFLGSFDYGTQSNTVDDTESATWWGFTAIARLQASSRVALAGRVERYADPDGVFITTVVGPGIEANGVSFDIEYAPVPRFLWRTEFRALFADENVFETHTGALTSSMPFIVSSFALTF